MGIVEVDEKMEGVDRLRILPAVLVNMILRQGRTSAIPLDKDLRAHQVRSLNNTIGENEYHSRTAAICEFTVIPIAFFVTCD